jgi:glutamate-5-semialdehyde dehydrogenase
MHIPELVHHMAREAKGAARRLGTLSREVKDRVILRAAELLEARRAQIQAANRQDVAAAQAQGHAAAFIERLTLSDKVFASMIKGLKEVAALPDPVGAVTGMWVRPNGLKVGKQRIPLGVIGFIYESRPNVTVDAAALCLKSGNTVILKGGKEALNSNLALAQLMQDALAEAGVPQAAVQVIPSVSREATLELLKQDDLVDLIIPRGGEGLIRFVSEHSRIPVLKHYSQPFVDESVDQHGRRGLLQRQAAAGKTLETMLIHGAALGFLPRMGTLPPGPGGIAGLSPHPGN